MNMYKDDSKDSESLIGSCTFELQTMVTQQEGGGMTVPTAALTASIIATVFALGVALCLYMSCCRSKKAAVASNATVAADDATSFKRMDDDGTMASTKDGSLSEKV